MQHRLAIITLSVFAVLTLQAADFTGKWAWTIKTPDGNSIKSAMDAKQAGSKLTGQLSRPGSDDKLEIKKGKVDGNDVSFTVVPNFQGGEITVEYTGRMKGDKIDGVIRVAEFDAELEWHAARLADDANPSGNWNWVLETPNGNEIEASLELKLKDGKLVGELVADNWAMEIEKGKVTGNKLSFQTTNPNSGQEYLSSGTIKGKKITGKVTFTNDGGEEVEMAWSAKKG